LILIPVFAVLDATLAITSAFERIEISIIIHSGSRYLGII
jgi:hypothetical protein